MRFLTKFSPLALIAGILTLSFLTGWYAFAQTADIPVPPSTTQDVIQAIAELVGGVKGASTLAIVALAVQLLSKFVLSPLWESLGLDPKYKFLVFALSSIAGAVVPLMIQGQTFLAAISNGAVLLLLMQYGHRIYELFFEKPKDA